MTSQPSGLTPQTQPMVKLLQGSPVLSGEGVRLIVRSYFVSSGFTSELVLGMPRADSAPTSKPGRTQSAILARPGTSCSDGLSTHAARHGDRCGKTRILAASAGARRRTGVLLSDTTFPTGGERPPAIPVSATWPG